MVSVIVAVYNVEQYIRRCLLSIKNQTYDDLEVIVVDDGAQDNSGTICDEISADDKRFRVIHKQNEGLGYARNTGLEYVHGDFVVFIDGDDFLELNMIETLVNYHNETNSDMVICGYKEYLDDSHVFDFYITKTPVIIEGTEDVIRKGICPVIGNDAHRKSNDKREMCVWTNLYSMRIIRDFDLKFESERVYLSEDFFFNISYMKHCKKVVIIPECLYYYRYNPLSLSHKYRPRIFEQLENFMEKAVELLDKEGISKYSSKRLQTLYFMKFRRALLQISNSELSFLDKKKKISCAISSNQCKKAINDYPIASTKINNVIMLWLIKKKYTVTLIRYMQFQMLLLNIRDRIKCR